MSARYEVSNDGGNTRVSFGSFGLGTATRLGSDTIRVENCIMCRTKYIIYVALCCQTVVILALVGIAAYLLQIPRPDVVGHPDQMTVGNITLEDVIDRLASLKGAQDKTKSELSDLKSALASAETKITNLKVVSQNDKRTIETMASEVSGLKSALATAEAKITTLTVVGQNDKRTIEIMATDVSDIKRALATAEAKITNLTVVDQNEKRTIENITTDMSGLKGAFDTAEAKITNLTVVVHNGKRTTENMASEVSDLKRALATAETKITNLTVAGQNNKRTIENIATDVSGLKIALATAEAKITNLTVVGKNDKKTMENITSEVSGLKSALSTAEAKLTKLAEVTTVMFTARDTAREYVGRGVNIIFPDVLSNEGGGYDNNTGVFTAPYNGLYSFTTTVCVGETSFVIVQLVAADIAIAATKKLGNEGYATCSSISGMAVLEKGDTALVKGAHSGLMFKGDYYRWPSFAGMLVHKT